MLKCRECKECNGYVCRGEILKIFRSEEQSEPIKIWCFGGAFSIDRQYRKLNESYWEEELPTDADYANSNKNLEAEELSE